eukprot:COSAG02_NODE_12761_length_1498_cov_1.801287_1_plen_350_part_10
MIGACVRARGARVRRARERAIEPYKLQRRGSYAAGLHAKMQSRAAMVAELADVQGEIAALRCELGLPVQGPVPSSLPQAPRTLIEEERQLQAAYTVVLSAGSQAATGGHLESAAELPPRHIKIKRHVSGIDEMHTMSPQNPHQTPNEVTLFGEQLSLSDTGLLDLKGKDIGPAKLKEVAALFSSPELAAGCRLILSGNMITDHGKDLSGLKAFCAVLPTLKHPISLVLTNCGLGVAEVAEVANAIGAGAVLNLLTLSSTGKEYFPKTYTLAAGEDKLELNKKNLGPADVNLISVWLATDAGAMVARLILDENPLTGGTLSTDFDNDITSVVNLCDTLKTSSVTELSLAKC